MARRPVERPVQRTGERPMKQTRERPVERVVPTRHGQARLFVVSPGRPSATLVLGHGAGGGVDSRDLVALAHGLPGAGIGVICVEQPWRVAGKRVASAPRVLDEAWVAVVEALWDGGDVIGRLVVGGRSAGARVACRTAHEVGAAAVVAMAFPLHPPGRPERSRHAELLAATVPTLVVQGERDPFGRPEEFPAERPYRLEVLPGADHGFGVVRRGPITQEEALQHLVSVVRDFVANA